MVVPADLIKIPLHPLTLGEGDVPHQLPAVDRVGLHALKLVRRQPPVLGQDVCGHGDLADVVHDGELGYGIRLLLGQSILGIVLHHIQKQQPGDLPDAADMKARVAVAKLNGRAQGLHDGFVGLAQPLLLLPDAGSLLQHHALQLKPVAVELHHIGHPALDHLGLEGTDQNIRHTQLIAPGHGLVRLLLGHQEDRDIVQPSLTLHDLQYIQPIDPGHSLIQENGCQLCKIGLCHLEGFVSIGGLNDLIC